MPSPPMRRQATCRHNASSGGNASSRGHASPGNVSSQCVARGDGDYRESVVAMRRQRVPQVMPSCGCPEFSSVWHPVLTYQEAAQITKKVPKSCKNAGRKMPNWCPTASRLGSQLDPWIGKNPLPQHLRPYFPLRRPTLAPIFLFRAPAVYTPSLLRQNGKSSLKPNGRSPKHTWYLYVLVTLRWVLILAYIFFQCLLIGARKHRSDMVG